MLSKVGFLSYQTSKFLQDMLICFEMVIAAIAHSFAFSYADFIDYSKNKNPILSNLGKVLNVNDLIVDVEKTFISENKKMTRSTALAEFSSNDTSETNYTHSDENEKFIKRSQPKYRNHNNHLINH